MAHFDGSSDGVDKKNNRYTKVRSLESNNQNVDSEKLENFNAQKATFLRDVEELQSHRRVVEDFQDAEALCELASSSEEHGWKVEILISDDNFGNFKRESYHHLLRFQSSNHATQKRQARRGLLHLGNLQQLCYGSEAPPRLLEKPPSSHGSFLAF
ncbi:hypothetical protein ACFX1Q_031979 [Malus domestica]